MPHATSTTTNNTSSVKESKESNAKPGVGIVRTIEEQVQLVRVFRLLAFEIPLQLVERKLEVLWAQLRIMKCLGECPGLMKKANRRSWFQFALCLQKLSEKIRGFTAGEKVSVVQRRKSCADYELKQERYVKEKAKFLATLQEETNNGREMVCTKYQITAKAIAALVEQLGGTSSALVLGKSHIEDLIWEVNDNLDGMISFEEFEKSYVRAGTDRTGLEPSELFFLISFLMFDKEHNGRIVLDDAMKIFYLKYGDAMEKEMESHFDSKLNEGAQFILFSEFYDAILKRSGELIDQQASISKSNKYCKKL